MEWNTMHTLISATNGKKQPETGGGFPLALSAAVKICMYYKTNSELIHVFFFDFHRQIYRFHLVQPVDQRKADSIAGNTIIHHSIALQKMVLGLRCNIFLDLSLSINSINSFSFVKNSLVFLPRFVYSPHHDHCLMSQ